VGWGKADMKGMALTVLSGAGKYESQSPELVTAALKGHDRVVWGVLAVLVLAQFSVNTDVENFQ